VEILKRLRVAVRWYRPELRPNDWVLRHDNASTHKALSARSFWSKNPLLKWNMRGMETIPLQEFEKCFQQWQAASLG
jgi:hypothetical protein